MIKRKGILDIDEVYIPFNPHFVPWHNKTYGTSLRFEEIHTYHLEEIVCITKEEMTSRFDIFFHTEEFSSIKPHSSSEQAVEYLSQWIDFISITDRPSKSRGATINQLGKNYKKCISEVHFTKSYDLSAKPSEKKVRKVDIALTLSPEYAFEDHPSHVLDYSRLSSIRRVYLFNQPWNADLRRDLPPKVVSVDNWNQVIDDISLDLER